MEATLMLMKTTAARPLLLLLLLPWDATTARPVLLWLPHAEACHRREIPYGHPFVELRLPWPPSPENHDRRQEHGGSMDVPGTGVE